MNIYDSTCSYEDRINHSGDGPITRFVAISRAVELAATFPDDTVAVANALYDILRRISEDDANVPIPDT